MGRVTEFAVAAARSRKGLWGITVASFLESTVVPIPFETIMVPVMLADRQRIWLIAALTTLGCLAGALAGYAVGYFAFESVGRWLLESLNYTEAFRSFREDLRVQGFWIILAIGITPVPFQVATVGSGLAAYPLLPFLLAATLARSLRYFGLALLTRLYGRRVAEVIKRHRRSAKLGFWALVVFALGYAVFAYTR